jgi:hypothetical protein
MINQVNKMGAPYGEKHGKGKVYPNWLVAAVISEHYDFGEPVKEIARILNISEYTIRSWVSYQTRAVH